jgi:hypothetical protein
LSEIVAARSAFIDFFGIGFACDLPQNERLIAATSGLKAWLLNGASMIGEIQGFLRFSWKINWNRNAWMKRLVKRCGCHE